MQRLALTVRDDEHRCVERRLLAPRRLASVGHAATHHVRAGRLERRLDHARVHRLISALDALPLAPCLGVDGPPRDPEERRGLVAVHPRRGVVVPAAGVAAVERDRHLRGDLRHDVLPSDIRFRREIGAAGRESTTNYRGCVFSVGLVGFARRIHGRCAAPTKTTGRASRPHRSASVATNANRWICRFRLNTDRAFRLKAGPCAATGTPADGGKTLKIKLTLKQAARLRLAERGRMNVTAIAKVQDAAGNRKRVQRSITLRSHSSYGGVPPRRGDAPPRQPCVPRVESPVKGFGSGSRCLVMAEAGQTHAT